MLVESLLVSRPVKPRVAPCFAVFPLRRLFALLPLLAGLLVCLLALRPAHAQLPPPGCPPPGGGGGTGSLTLTLNPTSVLAGSSSTATVTLSAAAPMGGASVTVSSSDTSKATVTSPVTVASGQTSATFTVSTIGTLTTPTSATITASYGGASATATLTINIQRTLPAVTSLRCTNLTRAEGTTNGSIRIDWNYTAPSPAPATHFAWTRTYLPPLTATLPAPEEGGTVTSQYVNDTYGYSIGFHYYYAVQAVPDDANNLVSGYHYVAGTSTSIPVVPESLPLVDNQAVDARYDPRYSTYTVLDHKFGGNVYRGGLYVGNATDSSRMGRSFMRFGGTAAPLDSLNHWYLPAQLTTWTSSLGAYFTGASHSSVGMGWSVGAQFVSDNAWTAANLCWSSAPTLTPSSGQAVNVTFDKSNPVFGWCVWPLGNTGLNAALASGGTVCPALAVTTESSDQSSQTYSWLYFAKREYDASKAPYLLFAWSAGPNVYVTDQATPPNTITTKTAQGGQNVTLTFRCLGLTSDLKLTLDTDDSTHVTLPATITIPTSTGKVDVTFSTATVTTSRVVKIIYDYSNYLALTLTP